MIDEFEYSKEIGDEADIPIPVEKVISIFINNVMKKHANY